MHFYGVKYMETKERRRNPQSCEVVIQRGGHDIETLYWAGPMQEACELARQIALSGGAESFRIVEFTSRGAPLMLAETLR
jgi:hypothetical protein